MVPLRVFSPSNICFIS